MKKIMFNDKFGLTKAVLKGRKVMTRRMVSVPRTFNGVEVCGWVVGRNAVGQYYTYLTDEEGMHIDDSFLRPHYEIGEEVAVAQSYKDIISCEYLTSEQENQVIKEMEKQTAGCTNKMFVKAELMPHRIRITNIGLERLQDIPEEDCLKEGVVECVREIGGAEVKKYYPSQRHADATKRIGWGVVYDTPRDAFARLIDWVSGDGTWGKNPYVFVYEFELLNRRKTK